MEELLCSKHAVAFTRDHSSHSYVHCLPFRVIHPGNPPIFLLQPVTTCSHAIRVSIEVCNCKSAPNACRQLKFPDDEIAMHAAAAVWHACKEGLSQSEKLKTPMAVHMAADLPCRNYVHLTLWAFLYPLTSPRAPRISLPTVLTTTPLYSASFWCQTAWLLSGERL